MAYRNLEMQAGNETKRNFYSRKPPFLELNDFFTPQKLPAIRYTTGNIKAELGKQSPDSFIDLYSPKWLQCSTFCIWLLAFLAQMDTSMLLR